MLTKFKCPDGVEISMTECLKKCRMETECTTKQIRKYHLNHIRKWNNVISTTQAFSGSRENYLKIIEDFSEEIDKLTFALFGTAVHSLLEMKEYENESGLDRMELKYKGEVIATGAYDYYDRESKTLYDYKTYGGYKASKVIGMNKTVTETIIDGKKKKKTVHNIDRSLADDFEPVMQLNCYRLMFEQKYPDDKVEKLKLQIIVRDGGTFSARNMGLDKRAYVIEIPFLNDKDVFEYYYNKNLELNNALKKGILPGFCNDRESWNGKKCEKFCSVSHLCGRVK